MYMINIFILLKKKKHSHNANINNNNTPNDILNNLVKLEIVELNFM